VETYGGVDVQIHVLLNISIVIFSASCLILAFYCNEELQKGGTSITLHGPWLEFEQSRKCACVASGSLWLLAVVSVLWQALFTAAANLLVLPSTVASHYYNCCTEERTNPGNYGYSLVDFDLRRENTQFDHFLRLTQKLVLWHRFT
jgi:hypothetical protein